MTFPFGKLAVTGVFFNQSMAVVNRNGDSSDLKHFTRFVTLFAVCPLYKNTLKTKIHVVIVSVSLITMFCYEMYGRIKNNFNSTVKTTNRTIVMSTCNTVTGFLCNIVITLPALFSNRIFEENIANELHQIDAILSKYTVKFHRRNNNYRMQVVFILTLFYIGLFLSDLSLWLELGGSDYRKESYYVLDRLFRYRICTVVIYLYYLIKGFLLRIMSINIAMETAFKRVTIQQIRNETQTLRELEKITADVCKLHAKFAHIVKNFNEIFGWQMLAILLNYILLFLVTYEMGLRIAAQGLKNTRWQHIFWLISLLIYAAVRLIFTYA